MAYKRPRSTFESDLQARESPFVLYGTPLPPLDSHTRDDGSYVPIWKQEVTDERGRKRLHGAFTGGFSAGYFNTVGSKEGWTPSSFVSSRNNRNKDAQKTQRAEDFMDDEDVQEREEAQKLQTSASFAGLGSTEADALRRGNAMDLFKPEGETIGVKLLRRMGWREGQGVGPKIRRRARYGDGAEEDQETHLFAPDDTQVVLFSKKDDRKGLGFAGESMLEDFGQRRQASEAEEDDEINDDPLTVRKKPNTPKSAVKPRKTGIGMGVLNDTGSDDEDPFEMGPRISYNKVIGGNKKKNATKATKAKSTAISANPLLASKPLFTSKKSSLPLIRKCHDGRLPLNGFVVTSTLDSTTDDYDRYPLPVVPPGWSSSKASHAPQKPANTTYQSAAEAAKASTLDPKARAALLGEASLPGKSVFDFLTTSARERIATASGRTDLPAARGEAPTRKSGQVTGIDADATSTPDLPTLDVATASAALSRSATGWMPYAEDPAKLSRYRIFLETQAGLRSDKTPPKPPEGMKKLDWMNEMREFCHAARVFRPVTGAMASRFQTSMFNGPQTSTRDDGSDETELLRKPSAKPKDPAEEAAAMGLYGPLTRKVLTFYPTRLVCKRFGVKPPAHVNSENEGKPAHGHGEEEQPRDSGSGEDMSAHLSQQNQDPTKDIFSGMKSFASGGVEINGKRIEGSSDQAGMKIDNNPARTDDEMGVGRQADSEIDTTINKALEAQRANEEVFRAVFGDDSDEE